MGITDKITGKTKQAIGDLTDDADTRRQGKLEERKADAKERVCTPTSRCCTRQFWLRCTNSIGSSTVMTWSCRWRFA